MRNSISSLTAVAARVASIATRPIRLSESSIVQPATVVVEHGRSQWQNLQQAKLVLVQRLQEVARRADSEKLLTDRNRQIARRTIGEAVHPQRATFRGRIARDGGSLAMVGLLPWAP